MQNSYLILFFNWHPVTWKIPLKMLYHPNLPDETASDVFVTNLYTVLLPAAIAWIGVVFDFL